MPASSYIVRSGSKAIVLIVEQASNIRLAFHSLSCCCSTLCEATSSCLHGLSAAAAVRTSESSLAAAAAAVDAAAKMVCKGKSGETHPCQQLNYPSLPLDYFHIEGTLRPFIPWIKGISTNTFFSAFLTRIRKKAWEWSRVTGCLQPASKAMASRLASTAQLLLRAGLAASIAAGSLYPAS